MMEKFDRVKLLIGSENFNKLQNSSVVVFGVGGVGGYTAEALVRSGIGKITLFDNDKVALSNINRQIIATTETLGQDKIKAVTDRLLSINPDLKIETHNVFYLPETADEFNFKDYSYIVDAVDTVTAKIEIIKRAKEWGVPVISCMGTGGKTNPTMLKVDDVEKTKGCPLARVMRKELKERGIKGVKVVYSEEQNIIADGEKTENKGKDRTAPPSMIFVPATAGLILAREVVFDIINKE
ncbi:MAG: tRNA threonylcarbamoyladenosine dehydratase [Clostridiales bacterium]|nr:tRNA threonylcarbamoyladenosine dehydratase [Clostridiales bacterium]